MQVQTAIPAGAPLLEALELLRRATALLIGETQRQFRPEPVLVSEGAAQRIVRVVCRAYGIQPEQIRTADRTRRIAIPRMVSAYFLRKRLQLSLPAIGRLLGGQHHTTVLSGIRKVERLIGSDPIFAETIRGIELRICAPKGQSPGVVS